MYIIIGLPKGESTLEGKNLLLKLQILYFMSRPPLTREAKMKFAVASPENVSFHHNQFLLLSSDLMRVKCTSQQFFKNGRQCGICILFLI